MGKNQPKTPVTTRAPRSKTPTQIAKAEANIKLANLRLVWAKQISERTGLTGSPTEIVDTYLDYIEKECDDEHKRLRNEAAEARMAVNRANYVAATLVGPSAYDLRRFLAGREATYQRVTAFFERSGLPDVATVAAKAA
jgi:hypothetical protein